MGNIHRIGIIGYGRMGEFFANELKESGRWEVAYVCDHDAEARARASRTVPGALVVADEEQIFADPTIEAVGLFTLADARPAQIRRALASRKHILAEKPIAADLLTEEQLLKEIEASGQLVAVNLFNRNAWYHKEALAFIAAGEIGKLGVIRVCHMSLNRLPTEDFHGPEGPPFHDCGLHYVDVARWYAGSEYADWHSQGVRMWDEEKPWWTTAHGQFQNGIVFELTVGWAYGQMAKDEVWNSYVECLGTHGVVRMHHDFRTTHLELYGIERTIKKDGPYGSKKLDVMCDVFARSLDAGRNLGFPTVRDSVIASRIAQQMLDDAIARRPPAIGTMADIAPELARRSALRANGKAGAQRKIR